MTTDELVARLRAAGCVFAEDEAAVLLESTTDATELERFVQLRERGLPLEHIVGWADFAGVRVLVEPGVFVPRPRTELLVDEAVSQLHPGATVLDLCCGSGAVGLAIAARVRVTLSAAELDPVAVATARRNLVPLGATVYEGDLYEPLPAALRGSIDLITVIAPYVPTDAIALLPHEARDFEPILSLDGGSDGLDLVRRIVAEAPLWLAHGGRLVTEVSEDQAPVVVELAHVAGLSARIAGDEETDSWVVVVTRD